MRKLPYNLIYCPQTCVNLCDVRYKNILYMIPVFCESIN